MKRWTWGLVLLLVGVGFSPAQAQTKLYQRCSDDALTPAQAEARVEWMRRCALLMNVGNPSAFFDTGMISPTGSYIFDYVENILDPNGAGSYLGDFQGREVNSTYISLLYLSGTTIQSVDADGFYKWTGLASRKKARPLYPTYANEYDIYSPTNLPLFPHPNLSNCALYLDPFGESVSSQPFHVSGYCESTVPTPLTNGVSLTGLSDGTGLRKYYSLEVPAGVTQVTFETSGGTGNVELRVRFGAIATFLAYQCKSARADNNEVCTISNPTPGTWYVMLYGRAAYSGVSLTGRY